MSLIGGHYDLRIYQGDIWTESFTLQTWSNYPTKPMVLTPEDLTDKVVRFQIRKNVKSSVVLLEGSTSDGRITVASPLTGQISIEVSADDTADLDFSCAIWDIEYYTTPDDTQTFLYGDVELIKQVTR